MAKTVKEQVQADILQAQKRRRIESLEQDYARWIAGAAKPQISKDDVKHFTSLAESTLAEINKLKGKT